MPNPLLRWRVPLGFALAAWYLTVARAGSVGALAVCAILVTLGCLLRSWAAGYLLKGKRVAVGGPYAYLRNPLYMGSFLIGLGFCAVLWRRPPSLSSIGLWLSFLIGFCVVYRAKSRAEEKELLSGLGEPYRRYAERVPAFWPMRGHVKGLGEQRFSWEVYRRNREHQCLLGSAAVFIVLLWRYSHVP